MIAIWGGGANSGVKVFFSDTSEYRSHLGS